MTPEEIASLRDAASAAVVTCDMCDYDAAFQCGTCNGDFCGDHRLHADAFGFDCNGVLRERPLWASVALTLMDDMERERREAATVIARLRASLTPDFIEAKIEAHADNALARVTAERDVARGERDVALGEIRAERRRADDLDRIADAAGVNATGEALVSGVLAAIAGLDDAHTRIAAQSAMLNAVANALKGPSPCGLHSHHDLGLRAAEMVAERNIAQQECYEWRTETAARHAEVCALLPGDPAQWTSADVADALVKTREERDALRAIVEGRTTAPTDAEVLAHTGTWRCIATIEGEIARGLSADCNDCPPQSAFTGYPRRIGRVYTERWWALDSQRRPCAWPVVAGGPDAER